MGRLVNIIINYPHSHVGIDISEDKKKREVKSDVKREAIDSSFRKPTILARETISKYYLKDGGSWEDLFGVPSAHSLAVTIRNKRKNILFLFLMN